MEAVKQSASRRMLDEAWACLAPNLPHGAPTRPDFRLPAVTPESTLVPVLDWLPALPPLAATRTRRLVAMPVEAAPSLCWRRTYGAGEVAPAFLARYGWAELLGAYGSLASDRLRLGFLMLGPDTLYPPHAHAAEELYLVLAGTAAWQRGDEPRRDRPPGMAIHHPPRLPHATRTTAEPLLALYLWWGVELSVHARLVSRADIRESPGPVPTDSAHQT